MSIRHGRGLAPFAVALAMAALLLPVWSVPAARAASAADAQASAAVRLINGERAYWGKTALRPDSYLAGKARDGSVWCPNNSSLVMAGRAKDMAVSGYFSHNLRLCPGYDIIDAMATWGYTRGRGEIISYNSVGVQTVSYAYGCSPSIATCPGPATTTYNTVARAMSGWMRSSVHYSIITGSYDRVGCGAWVSSSGVYYYACLFAAGGSPIVTPRPRPVATPRPKPVATPPPPSEATPEDVASTTPDPTQPPPWPTPPGARTWFVVPDPARAISDGDGPAADGLAADGLAAGLPSPAQPSDEGLPEPARAALAVVGVAWTLVFVWLRLGPRRRYRPRGTGLDGG